jgi:hypothetical protein
MNLIFLENGRVPASTQCIQTQMNLKLKSAFTDPNMRAANSIFIYVLEHMQGNEQKKSSVSAQILASVPALFRPKQEIR